MDSERDSERLDGAGAGRRMHVWRQHLERLGQGLGEGLGETLGGRIGERFGEIGRFSEDHGD